MTKICCLACDILAGKTQPPGGLIHRDGLWVVDHAMGLRPDDPIPLRGFLIVSPVRHVENIFQLTDEEQAEFGLLLKDVALAIKRVLAPEKIHVCSFGELVGHVHWYVIPRSADMPKSGLQVLDGIFNKRRWTCTVKEAAMTALKVKAELEALLGSRGGDRDCPYSVLF